ncbi:S1 family peptidase [Streptomyces hainanensis]|uniref:S1 family peptidase n=1 Tax=Streptomyces hainanensis TaxID=402648 RepID=A0A4R4TQL6_9ACTN|nr:S1 family peptidase [Streptomyces hainanensis]TDC77662.1 S1 family peptidase [Streptomyces hainanensis]
MRHTRRERTTGHRPGPGRARLIAALSGLAALALLLPGVAAADSGQPRTFSATQLADAGDAVLAADVPGTAWAVDHASGTVRVTADETVSATELAAIRRAAGPLADALVIERTPGRLQAYPRGGDAIFAWDYWRCTLGFNVRIGTTYYFITAGHCLRELPPRYVWWPFPKPPDPPNPPDPRSGFGVHFSYPGNDYGLVQYQGVPDDLQGVVNLYNGSVQDITGAANPIVGQSACRSGGTTGLACGSVTGLNYTVNYPDGVVTGLIRTNICAEPGDSGGPLFNGPTALGLTSGGSGNCSSGGTTYFQPVVEVLNAYGATVY